MKIILLTLLVLYSHLAAASDLILATEVTVDSKYLGEQR